LAIGILEHPSSLLVGARCIKKQPPGYLLDGWVFHQIVQIDPAVLEAQTQSRVARRFTTRPAGICHAICIHPFHMMSNRVHTPGKSLKQTPVPFRNSPRLPFSSTATPNQRQQNIQNKSQLNENKQ
jgi:hypothetical protein